MTTKRTGSDWRRATATALVALILAPLLAAAPAQARTRQEQPTGIRAVTTKQKVVLLAGAALLYYLYKKHQAKQNMTAASTAGANPQPQLYRSKNGGVYYRDPRTHQPTWLTVPRQPVQVPAAALQQYAPDYRQFQGRPAPAVPNGYRTQPFSAFDSGAPQARGPAGPRM